MISATSAHLSIFEFAESNAISPLLPVMVWSNCSIMTRSQCTLSKVLGPDFTKDFFYSILRPVLDAP